MWSCPSLRRRNLENHVSLERRPAEDALSSLVRAQLLAQSRKITIFKFLFVPIYIFVPLQFLKEKIMLPAMQPPSFPFPTHQHSFIVFPHGCFCGIEARNSQGGFLQGCKPPDQSCLVRIQERQNCSAQAFTGPAKKSLICVTQPIHLFGAQMSVNRKREQMGVNKGLSFFSCLLTL